MQNYVFTFFTTIPKNNENMYLKQKAHHETRRAYLQMSSGNGTTPHAQIRQTATAWKREANDTS